MFNYRKRDITSWVPRAELIPSPSITSSRCGCSSFTNLSSPITFSLFNGTSVLTLLISSSKSSSSLEPFKILFLVIESLSKENLDFLEQNDAVKSIDAWLRSNHNDVDLIVLDYHSLKFRDRYLVAALIFSCLILNHKFDYDYEKKISLIETENDEIKRSKSCNKFGLKSSSISLRLISLQTHSALITIIT